MSMRHCTNQKVKSIAGFPGHRHTMKSDDGHLAHDRSREANPARNGAGIRAVSRLSCAVGLPTLMSEAEMTTHLKSEQIDKGLSRRGLVQALATGAAPAAVATPSLAQHTTVAEATAADYARDPTRWGSAEVAALFPGFKHLDMRTKGAVIRVRHGGSGPPSLPLHGYPENHLLCYAVPAALSSRYHLALAGPRR